MALKVEGDLTSAKLDAWGKEVNAFLTSVNSSFNNLMALFVTLLVVAALASVLSALSSITRFRVTNQGSWLQFVIFTCGADLGCLCMLWSCTGLEGSLNSEVGKLNGKVASMCGNVDGHTYDEISYLTLRLGQWSRYKGVSFLGINLSAGQLKAYIVLLITQPIMALLQEAWNWAVANFGL